MNTSYSLSFQVDKSPEEVFAAIKQVPQWSSGEVAGDTDRLGGEFTYRVPGVHYSKQQITEYVPGRTVVWHVTDSLLSYINNQTEWTGTTIRFDISEHGGQTEVRFTHEGLISGHECYGACSNAWSALVNGNLRRLIATGETQPSPFG